MNTKRFQKRVEDFVCEHCGTRVGGSGYTNHCPKCLWSKHVDVYPGDRANPCQGLMDPIGYENDGKKGFVLRFVCRLCRQMTRNIAAHEDPLMPDNYEQILKLGEQS